MLLLPLLISSDTLDNPSPKILPLLEKHQEGFVINIHVAIYSDTQATKRSKIMFGVISGIVLLISYFLGVSYLVINAAIFFLSGLARVSQQAQANAHQQIIALATILDRWRRHNISECEQWLQQAWSLRSLYDAVKNARGAA